MRRALRRGDSGAAAVEFALIVPIFLLVAFGLIDYGLFFADTQAVRQGARDGARQGSIGGSSFGTNTACSMSFTGSPSTDIQALICQTKLAVGISGPVGVKVAFKTPGTESDTTYTQGNDLKVCVVGERKSVTGLTPYPKSGLMQTTVRIRIERPTSTPTESAGQGASTGFSVDWSFCP